MVLNENENCDRVKTEQVLVITLNDTMIDDEEWSYIST